MNVLDPLSPHHLFWIVPKEMNFKSPADLLGNVSKLHMQFSSTYLCHFFKTALLTSFVYITLVLGTTRCLSTATGYWCVAEVCLYMDADWLMLICQSESERSTGSELSKRCNFSQGTVHPVIHEELGIKKVCAIGYLLSNRGKKNSEWDVLNRCLPCLCLKGPNDGWNFNNFQWGREKNM